MCIREGTPGVTLRIDLVNGLLRRGVEDHLAVTLTEIVKGSHEA